MKLVPIGDVTVRAISANPAKLTSHTFSYVDLSSVDQNTKEISAPKVMPVQEAPSRARQVISPGDVLVSTVRPNLNGVAKVSPALEGAIASTGFTVLRSKRKLIDSNYLFHWVKSPAFISDMVTKSTGASYPAVSDKIVRESLVPLPIVEEQRRIAAILDKADELRTKRRQAIAHLDALTQSIFHSIFGALDRNNVLSDAVSDLVGGRNLVGADDSTNSYRVLKISAVTSGRYIESESKPLPVDYEPVRSHLVRTGDVIISRANTAELVGASALVDATNGTTMLPDKLWRAVPAPGVVPRFLLAALQTKETRDQMSRVATGSGGSMKNIRNLSFCQSLSYSHRSNCSRPSQPVLPPSSV